MPNGTSNGSHTVAQFMAWMLGLVIILLLGVAVRSQDEISDRLTAIETEVRLHDGDHAGLQEDIKELNDHVESNERRIERIETEVR